MVVLDGSRGEGGGQVLRTALTLSLCRGMPFRIDHVRARRKTPGLRPQHMAVVNAAAEVCSAEVTGATLGSQTLTFHPHAVRAGAYRFDIGTAGSATLLLQTLMLPLVFLGEISRIEVVGGTHNPLAPSYDFLAQTYLPVLSRMGAQVETRLMRHGFYPAGGGRVEAVMHPVQKIRPIALERRGLLQRCTARALLAHLHANIGERELRVAARRLALAPEDQSIEYVASDGPGNAVLITAHAEQITETFTAIGERGRAAEIVAAAAVDEAQRYTRDEVPVGRHLADQLLLPMALAGAGVFVTQEPSPHTMTNMDVIAQFLGVRFSVAQSSQRAWRIAVA